MDEHCSIGWLLCISDSSHDLGHDPNTPGAWARLSKSRESGNLSCQLEASFVICSKFTLAEEFE